MAATAAEEEMANFRPTINNNSALNPQFVVVFRVVVVLAGAVCPPIMRHSFVITAFFLQLFALQHLAKETGLKGNVS